MADIADWLRRIAKGGLSAIPPVGGLLAEGAGAWFQHLEKQPDLRAIDVQLSSVVAHAKVTDSVLETLLSALDAGTVEEPFLEPIQDLCDAIENPDKPPARVRAILEHVQERGQTFETFQQDCGERFADLQKQIDALTGRVERIDDNVEQIDGRIKELEDRPPTDVETIREVKTERTTTRAVALPVSDVSSTIPGRISNLPLRNPDFTGREKELKEIEHALASGPAALTHAPQAIHGLGGVGKTQLANEYAHLHAGEYDILWWVRSGEPTELLADYAALAEPLKLPGWDNADRPAVAASVCAALRERGPWLLIFDNAPDRDAVRKYLPEGNGHVFITSPWTQWAGLASPFDVKTFTREESIRFLRRRVDGSATDLDALAEALGDLPLALAMAASYIVESGKTPATYLKLFRESGKKLLRRQKPPEGYNATVATTWDVSIAAVRNETPAAADLLKLLAFLAPENIPCEMIAGAPDHFPNRLAAAVRDETGLDECVAALRRYSLVDASGGFISVHRLLQTVTRQGMRPQTRRRWIRAALRVANKAVPLDSDDVRTWPVVERVLPHAQAAVQHADEADITEAPVGRLLNQSGVYLLARAEFEDARACLERALKTNETAFGPNHPDVAMAVNNLGRALQGLGDLVGAKKCFKRALKIGEFTLGRNHPNVATTVNNLGLVLQALGDLTGAKKCFERAFDIGRSTLGRDHPNVATVFNNLGLILKDLGDLVGAKKYIERALKIGETAFGPDHPKVAFHVDSLGVVLFEQGDIRGALGCAERALAIYQARLGPDHPDTRASRENVRIARERLDRQ